jgi:hypothetical protein
MTTTKIIAAAEAMMIVVERCGFAAGVLREDGALAAGAVAGGLAAEVAIGGGCGMGVGGVGSAEIGSARTGGACGVETALAAGGGAADTLLVASSEDCGALAGGVL